MYETTYEGDISYSDKQFLRTELDKNLLLFYSLLTNLFTFYEKKKKKKSNPEKGKGHQKSSAENVASSSSTVTYSYSASIKHQNYHQSTFHFLQRMLESQNKK